MTIIEKMVKKKKRGIPKQGIELLIIVVLSIIFFYLASRFDMFENIYNFSRAHEEWEIDEIVTVSVFLVLAFLIFTLRRMQEFYKNKNLLQKKNTAFENALNEIKELKGIIPICSSCKSIRDDKGYWKKVETYIEEHSKAEFSHGICPTCAEKLYPGMMEQIRKNKDQPV